MFSQPNNEEKKLDWMYQGANSLVDREDYLLGKSVDKSLEQLNAEEKLAASNSGAVPKNHVEHECIPPSIRDYKQQQLGDQVDIAAKLQEDPLIAIKKREEETRRQFLQNPVQIAKLQRALKKRDKKLKKSKKNKLDTKLAKKIKLLTGSSINFQQDVRGNDLDTILMHKFNSLRSLISEDELQKVLKGESSESESGSDSEKGEDDSDSGSDEKSSRKRSKKKKDKKQKSNDRESKKKGKSKRKKYTSESDDEKYKNAKKSHKSKYSSESEDNEKKKSTKSNKHKKSSKQKSEDDQPKKTRGPQLKPKSDSDSDDNEAKKSIYMPKSKNYSSDSDDERPKRPQQTNFGLVKADGTKIPLSKNTDNKNSSRRTEADSVKAPPQKSRYQREKLTEEEKEKRRLEMVENAVWRDKERNKNVKKYREEDKTEAGSYKYDDEFMHKQLVHSVNQGTVESRIKANRKNIQRDSNAMNTNFSKR